MSGGIGADSDYIELEYICMTAKGWITDVE